MPPDEKSNNNPLIICQMYLLYIEEFMVVSIRPTGRLGLAGSDPQTGLRV